MSVAQIKKSTCTKVSTYDLTQKKVWLETALEIVEGDTPAAIKQLSQLFGHSFCVDVRKIFPKVGLPVANMGSGTTVNLVAPTELNKEKISFRYDTVASKLNVTIWYKNSVFGANFMDRHGHSSQFMFLLPSPPTNY